MIEARYIDPGKEPELNRAIGDFVSMAIFGKPGQISDYASMAAVEDGRVIAGVLYNNYQPEAGVIEIHGASSDTRWLTRPVLNAMFAYPFDQLGCQMVVARNAEDATALRRMWRAVGATEYVIPRLRGRGEAEAIATLTDDAWRSSRFHKDAA